MSTERSESVRIHPHDIVVETRFDTRHMTGDPLPYALYAEMGKRLWERALREYALRTRTEAERGRDA